MRTNQNDTPESNDEDSIEEQSSGQDDQSIPDGSVTDINRRSLLRSAGAASAAGLVGLPAFTGGAVAQGKPCHKDFSCAGDNTYVKFEFDEDACEFVEETSTGLIEITDWSPECDPTYVEWNSSLGDVTTVMAFGGTDCDTVDDPGESYNADQAGEAGLDNPGGQTAAISNLQFCVAPLEVPADTYIGYEDRPPIGDFDYNDFGMRAEIMETYPAGTLDSISMEFTARFHRADDSHDIHILRTFDSDVEWDLTIGRSQPAAGNEQAAGDYSGSGDLDVIIFDSDHFKQDVDVTLDVTITSGSVNPPTTSPRPDVGANNPLFEVYDPYMNNRSRPSEGVIDLDLVRDNVVSSDLRTNASSWETSSDVPNIIVVPDPNFAVPGENVTITDDYPQFDNYYTDGSGDTDEDLDPDPTYDEWYLNPSP